MAGRRVGAVLTRAVRLYGTLILSQRRWKLSKVEKDLANQKESSGEKKESSGEKKEVGQRS